jgi:hypothetical protein
MECDILFSDSSMLSSQDCVISVISVVIILHHFLSISSYFPSLRSGLRWFSMISRHTISLYLISIHFPVMIRSFFSSVAMRRRSQLLRSFCHIPLSLNNLSPISRSSCHCLWGNNTTATCSVVLFSCSASFVDNDST